MKIYCYPKCTTCKKATKFLKDNDIAFIEVDYTKDILSIRHLEEILRISKIDIKKLFNTSGTLYKEMNLKDKLADLSTNDKLKLLSENPMLIKRPILLTDKGGVLVGFKEETWTDTLLN